MAPLALALATAARTLALRRLAALAAWAAAAASIWQAAGGGAGAWTAVGLGWLGWAAVRLAAWRSLRARLADDEALAVALGERLLPRWQGRLQAAHDLSVGEPAGPSALADAWARLHRQQVAQELARCDLAGELRARLGAQMGASEACAACALAVVGLALAASRPAADVAPTAPAPWATDIAVTVQFPAYQGRAARHDPACDGGVVAPLGSQVSVSLVAAAAAGPAVARRCRAAATGPCADIPLVAQGRGRLGASFPVDGPGSIQYRPLRLPRPWPWALPVMAVDIEPDLPPQARLLAPAVNSEVCLTSAVEIAWTARDDHGVGDVAWVVEAGDATGPFVAPRWRLALPHPGGPSVRGRARWQPPAELTAASPAYLWVSVEAADNDDVVGPNRTATAPRPLRVRAAQGRMLLAVLVDWLAAAHADGPAPPPAALAARAEALAGELGARSLLPAAGINRLLAHIAAAVAGGVEAQARTLTRLREDVLYLDDLLATEALARLQRRTERAVAAPAALAERLAAWHPKTAGEAIPSALAAEARALRAELEQLVAALGSARAPGAAGEGNAGAVPAAQLARSLDGLDQALARGDAALARDHLSALAGQVAALRQQLDRQEQGHLAAHYAEARQELGRLGDQANALAERQRAAAEQARGLAERARARSAAAAGGSSLDEALAGLAEQAELAAVQAAALAREEGGRPPWARAAAAQAQPLAALARSLRRHEIATAGERLAAPRELMTRWAPARPAAQRAQRHLDAVAHGLARLVAADRQPLTGANASEAGELAAREAELARQVEAMAAGLAAQSAASAFVGADAHRQAADAAAAARRAGEALGAGQARPGAQAGEEAARLLGELAGSLADAAQASLPTPVGMPAAAGSPQQAGPDAGEELALPAEEHQGLPAFRREVLEAAKKAPPRNWEAAVERYYQELLR